MWTKLVVVMAVVILAPAGILLAQQQYPKAESPVLLENDRVVVQRNDFEAGAWVGEHSHAGNQLAVVLDETEVVYKEGEKETTESYKAGDVFLVDAAKHDHKSVSRGAVILITIK